MREQVREGMNPRAYVLAGLLVVVLLWVQSIGERARPASAPARAAGSGASAAAPAIEPTAGGKTGPSTPTPEGWGRDPFDQRFGRPQGGDR